MSGSFKVHVRLLNFHGINDFIVDDLYVTNTVWMLEDRIRKSESLYGKSIKIIFAGKELLPDMTLKECGISKGVSVYVLYFLKKNPAPTLKPVYVGADSVDLQEGTHFTCPVYKKLVLMNHACDLVSTEEDEEYPSDDDDDMPPPLIPTEYVPDFVKQTEEERLVELRMQAARKMINDGTPDAYNTVCAQLEALYERVKTIHSRLNALRVTLKDDNFEYDVLYRELRRAVSPASYPYPDNNY